jgi:hypothetical protein
VRLIDIMIRYKRKDKLPKLTRSIRIPIELDNRIKELSQKNLTSYNAWATTALVTMAYKHDKDKRYQLLNKIP